MVPRQTVVGKHAKREVLLINFSRLIVLRDRDTDFGAREGTCRALQMGTKCNTE